MDFRQLFFNDAVEQEFLDRFDELADSVSAQGGLEGLEGGLSVDRAAAAVASMKAGTWASEDPGVEAIVERFTRPVHLVQRSTFVSAADGLPESVEVANVLDGARAGLEAAIPSVGRIELSNHWLEWAGTGWMVGPGLVATARHVAQQFAEHSGGFAFRHISGRTVRAKLDWYQEYQQPEESSFRVRKVEWIEPDASIHDVALLRIAETGDDGQSPPPVIELLVDDTLTDAGAGRWVGVIGFPGNDERGGRLADRQRIFDGIYDCKRLAAGRLTAVTSAGLVFHDATTLGGNSGSAVLDLATGKAFALHFRGFAGVRNSAVHAAVVARIVREHAS